MPSQSYKKFIADIVGEINYAREQKANKTGKKPKRISLKLVREVLQAIPSAFQDLEEGDRVKTPMGVFRMTRRKSRLVRIPNSEEYAEVPSALVVKLRPGKQLRFEL